MKSLKALGDDMNMHRCVAAYASDWGLAVLALRPHGIPFPSAKLKIVTSLDHAMWFHAPFRADEWMLYEMESPRMAGSRSINFGRIYTKDGVLAITVAQEALIRLNSEETSHIGA